MLTITIAFASNCQDTINVNRAQFVKVLTKAQQAKVYELQIAQFQKDTALLSYRIAEKQSIIDNLQDKDGINKKIIATYESQITVMQDQRKLLEAEITNLSKLVKKFHRKMVWRSLEGVGLGVLTFIIGKHL